MRIKSYKSFSSILPGCVIKAFFQSYFHKLLHFNYLLTEHFSFKLKFSKNFSVGFSSNPQDVNKIIWIVRERCLKTKGRKERVF